MHPDSSTPNFKLSTFNFKLSHPTPPFSGLCLQGAGKGRKRSLCLYYNAKKCGKLYFVILKKVYYGLSKTKTGRRKNIVPIEVKSAKRYTQISLDKFCDKFRPYIDLPTVLYVNDRRAKDGVAYLPLYATQAFLESV